MRKLLKPIGISGVVLCFMGIAAALIWGSTFGGWLCGIGMVLCAVNVIYKACHWTEFERENRQNIKIMLLATILIILQLLIKTYRG